MFDVDCVVEQRPCLMPCAALAEVGIVVDEAELPVRDLWDEVPASTLM